MTRLRAAASALSVVMTLALSAGAAGCAEEFVPPEKSEADKKAEERERQEAKKRAKKVPATPVPAEPKEPAKPDPTDPKEIAEARNLAILDGRYDDAVRLCGKENFAEIGGQNVLACVLAACRRKDTELARKWAESLEGKLKQEGFKVCKSQGIIL